MRGRQIVALQGRLSAIEAEAAEVQRLLAAVSHEPPSAEPLAPALAQATAERIEAAAAVDALAVAAEDPDGPVVGNLRRRHAAARLGLRYVVLTSVNRDDLADGGASQFVACIEQVRQRSPLTTIELLIPDFCGDWDALAAVMAGAPDVLNHNIETVPRLYKRARDRQVNRVAMRAINRLEGINLVSIGYPEDTVIQANVVISTSRDQAAQWLKKLERDEQARLAAAQPNDRVVLALMVQN